jgi:Protein of unknown function (DUF3011)
MERVVHRDCLLALLGVFAFALPAAAGADQKTRTQVQQPALKQAPASQSRSAQDDCVREANRRGFTVLDTSNFQQFRDGWSIDLRVRNQRGQVSNGSCFVETRTGEINLYGFGWGYDDDGDDYMQFNCASVERKYRECQLPVRGRAVLVKRLSDSPCIEGSSWGQRSDRVWVSQGCRAKFEVRRGGGSGGGGGGSNVVDCNSDGGRYRECSIGSGYFGRLLRDNSNGRCRQNSTWGTRNGVIWVTEGCRGRFERVRGNSGGNNNNGWGGSGGSSPARAEQACVNEVQRRGWRVLQQSIPGAMSGGYRMQLRVRTQSGEQRSLACTYSSQTQQVRLDPL